jgi:hypothetical protein
MRASIESLIGAVGTEPPDDARLVGTLTPSLAARLPELYRTPFSVAEYFAEFHGVVAPPAAITFGPATAPRHVLCYCVGERSVRVLNEFIALERADLERFVAAIFACHPTASELRLVKVECDLAGSPLAHRRVPAGVDYAIALPATVEEYQARLGQSTRRNLNLWRNRLRKAHPEMRFDTARGGAITRDAVRRVVEMNRLRMRVKGKRPGIDGEYEEQIFRFAGSYGVLSTLILDGELVAGVLCSRVGRRQFLHVIAHDPRHDALRLGHLCLQFAIHTAIEEGVDAFHLLWGDFEYKSRFGGVRVEQHDLVVYRSRWSKWGDLRTIAALAQRRSKDWLLRRLGRVPRGATDRDTAAAASTR